MGERKYGPMTHEDLGAALAHPHPSTLSREMVIRLVCEIYRLRQRTRLQKQALSVAPAARIDTAEGFIDALGDAIEGEMLPGALGDKVRAAVENLAAWLGATDADIDLALVREAFNELHLLLRAVPRG